MDDTMYCPICGERTELVIAEPPTQVFHCTSGCETAWIFNERNGTFTPVPKDRKLSNPHSNGHAR